MEQSPPLPSYRTARGYEHGTALTFLTPGEEELLSELEDRMKGGQGSSGTVSSHIKPYKFRMSEVEGFRYRVKVQYYFLLLKYSNSFSFQDALRAITKASSEYFVFIAPPFSTATTHHPFLQLNLIIFCYLHTHLKPIFFTSFTSSFLRFF